MTYPGRNQNKQNGQQEDDPQPTSFKHAQIMNSDNDCRRHQHRKSLKARCHNGYAMINLMRSK
jgi:hypothetical protein